MDRVEQRQGAIDDFLDVLRHVPGGDTWVGRTPDWDGPVVFGGVGLALTISAACSDAPEGCETTRGVGWRASYRLPGRGQAAGGRETGVNVDSQ